MLLYVRVCNSNPTQKPKHKIKNQNKNQKKQDKNKTKKQTPFFMSARITTIARHTSAVQQRYRTSS
jgi:hypothetical protein